MSYLTNSDWHTEVAAGRVPGWSVVHKFGRNDVVGTSPEDIWLNGGLYTWRQTAGKVVLASSNAGDGTAGNGARAVVLQGLDGSFALQEETVSLAGTATVKSVNDWIRIHRAYCVSQGTYSQSNTGTISCMWSVSPTAAFSIGRGFGQTEVAWYTVPANHEAFVKSISVHVEATKPATLRFFVNDNADDTTVPVGARRLQLYFAGVDGWMSYNPVSPLHYPEKTDLYWSAFMATGSGEVSVIFEMLLHDLS